MLLRVKKNEEEKIQTKFNNYMKIYFAGSIRGGRNDKELYSQIIRHIQKYGEVLTEHIGNEFLSNSITNDNKFRFNSKRIYINKRN